MAKDIDSVDREFAHDNYLYYESPESDDPPESEEKPDEPKSGKRKRSRGADIFFNVMFYVCLVIMVICVFIYAQGNKNGASLFGYSFYNIQSGSMQSVYPKGSLVGVKVGNSDVIEAGDDISFLVSANTVVTHRCIEVLSDYNNTGFTVYRTQGVENQTPDENVVFENNVIGKVAFCIPYLGGIMESIADNVLVIAIVLVGIILLSFGVKGLWGETRTEREKRRAIKALQKEKVAAQQKSAASSHNKS